MCEAEVTVILLKNLYGGKGHSASRGQKTRDNICNSRLLHQNLFDTFCKRNNYIIVKLRSPCSETLAYVSSTVKTEAEISSEALEPIYFALKMETVCYSETSVPITLVSRKLWQYVPPKP
jgi:hypothetical protein